MIRLAVGIVGTGKTHATAALVKRHLDMRRKQGINPVVLIHDLKVLGPGGRLEKRAIGALAPTVCESPELWLAMDKPPRVCAFYGCPLEDVFEMAEGLARDWQPVLVVADEIEEMGIKIRRGDPGFWATQMGRKVPLDIIGSGHAPQMIWRGFFRSANEVLLFQITEQHALASLDKMGWSTPGGKKWADLLPVLPPRRFYRVEITPDQLK